MIKTWQFLLLVGVVAACGFGCSNQAARLTVEVSRPSEAQQNALLSGPAAASGFDCVAVNVTASDIGTVSAGFPTTGLTSPCTYPGKLSSVASMPGAGATASIEVEVPTGSSRTVQVLGISLGSSGLTCATVTSESIFPSSGKDVKVEAYLLGSTSGVSTQNDVTVNVANTYAASARVNCVTGETTTEPDTDTVLGSGTYQTGCINSSSQVGAGPGAMGVRKTLTISGHKMTHKVVYYLSGCGSAESSGATVTQSNITFTLGDAVARPIVGNQINLTFDTTTVQPGAYAGAFNAMGTGCPTVTNGVTTDISGQCGTSASLTGSTAYPAVGETRYDIVAKSGNNLYFGQFYGYSSLQAIVVTKHTPGTALTADNRPSAYAANGTTGAESFYILQVGN